MFNECLLIVRKIKMKKKIKKGVKLLTPFFLQNSLYFNCMNYFCKTLFL